MTHTSQSEDDLELQKYKELFDLSKEVFSEELERSSRIDAKASQYLAILTFLLSVFALFGRDILDTALPPDDFLEWFLVVGSGVVIAIILLSWLFIFSALDKKEIRKIPIATEFFRTNKLVDVYYTMSRSIQENLIVNRKNTNRRLNNLTFGYKLIGAAMILLFVLFIVFVTHEWLK